jgi:hypothetical protein
MCCCAAPDVQVVLVGGLGSLGSTGGILAVGIGKVRGFLRANRLGLFQKTKEK